MDMPGEIAKATPFGLLEDWETALSDYSVFDKHGTLAYAGGWRDQPVEWRESMLYIQAVYSEEFNKLAKTRR